MSPEDLLFQEATDAFNKGDLPQAQDLFARLLKINNSNPEYWLYMSAAVPTKKERGYCLKEVLKLDPTNRDAIIGLRLMGENYADPEPGASYTDTHVDWKTSLEVAQPQKVSGAEIRGRIFGFTVLGLVVVGAIVVGVYLAMQPKRYVDNSPILRWTITPPPTETATFTPAPTYEGTPPLLTSLDATFTPTPVYVATPHNRSEAYSAAIKAYAKQDWSNAAGYFKQVIASEPNSPDLYFLLGEVYRFQDLFKDAITTYDQAIKLDATFGPAYLGKGRAQLESSPPKIEEARANFERAVENDPALTEAFYELANVSLAEGDGATALAFLEKASSNNGKNALIYYSQAKAYMLLGGNANALTAVEKSRELDRSYLPVYKLWAEVLQANNRPNDSIAPLEVYLKYDPLDLGSELLLAQAYIDSNLLDKALSSVNVALSSDNKFLAAYVTRGDIYLLQNKIDLAEKDYDTALRLNYYSFDAIIGKSKVLLAQTLAGSAYNQLLRAEDLAKTKNQKAILLYWRAKALMGLDEIKAAIRDYEAFLALPLSDAPTSLREKALSEYLLIVTPTPSITPTRTTTPTVTPTPTKTVPATATPKQSITPTK